jgi:hypothetical protein
MKRTGPSEGHRVFIYTYIFISRNLGPYNAGFGVGGVGGWVWGLLHFLDMGSRTFLYAPPQSLAQLNCIPRTRSTGQRRTIRWCAGCVGSQPAASPATQHGLTLAGTVLHPNDQCMPTPSTTQTRTVHRHCNILQVSMCALRQREERQ